MLDVGEILLQRLEYLSTRTGENSQAAWIQFCEVVAVATLLHRAGHLTEGAMRSVMDLAEKLAGERGQGKKGSCKHVA